MRDLRFREFRRGDLAYLTGFNMAGMDDLTVDGFSVDMHGGRMWHPVACFGACWGESVKEHIPSDIDAGFAFLSRRAGAEFSAIVMGKQAKAFMSRQKGVLVTTADDEFPKARRYLEWMGFEPTGLKDSAGRDEYLWEG